MNEKISIVDQGRGPQLSTSRITVQDLVPYLQQQYTSEQIVELMPSLNIEEIEAVRLYVRDHYEEVMAQDRLIRQRAAHRKTTPEIEEVLRRGGEKMAALRQQFAKKKEREPQGDHVAG